MKITKIAFLMTLMALTAMGLQAAEPQTYELKLNCDFTELKVVDGLNVEYRCNPDSAGYAVFTTTADKASLLLFSPKKNKLKIELADLENMPADLPVITVYSSSLEKVENCADSLVRVIAPAEVAKFQAKVVGNGRISVHSISATTEVKASIVTGRGQIVISGNTPKAGLSITGGAGVIQADGLIANEVSARIVGTGTIGCYCSGRLGVYGAGTGKVYYTGEPTEIAGHGVGINACRME